MPRMMNAEVLRSMTPMCVGLLQGAADSLRPMTGPAEVAAAIETLLFGLNASYNDTLLVRRLLVTILTESRSEAACTWREDADGNWHTGCGHIFCFNDDGPIKNGLKFCGYCGSGLKEEPYKEAEESHDV